MNAMHARSRRDAVLSTLRRVLLFGGVAAITVALVGSLDAEFSVVGIDPWWQLGVLGLVAVLVGLGSPWAGRLPSK
jgi:hypothetical protein